MGFANLEKIIKDSIKDGFPSAQIAIEHKSSRIYQKAFGHRTLIPSINCANLMTHYDIASLTKVFSLAFGFQSLLTNGKCELDCSLFDLLEEEIEQGLILPREKEAITLYDLLTHSAGFEPNPLFYDPTYSETLFCQDRSQFLQKLLLTPLVHPPKTTALYSDVDFMLLTFLFERLAGESLQRYLKKTFWTPLGIEDSIDYRPLENAAMRDNIAATELAGNRRDGAISFPNIRQEVIYGEVQDEKGFHCMDGISGHAGLFANSDALLKLMALMRGDNDYFSNQVIEQFLTPSRLDPTFGIGWRLNGADMGYMCGDYASSEAYGHTGWTGCLILRDPKYDLTISYLTNRKHTRVVDPGKNPNLFYGDTLPAGKYRIIVNEIYRELGLA